MSSFGKIFKITTFGESHGKSVGVIVDGCPSKLNISDLDIQKQLDRRRPGQSKLSTPRNEQDKCIILSGMENNLTLGTPISVIVNNKDTKKKDYNFLEPENYIPRPSHADFTYHMKYGIHASSGGGRSSARETIGRVIGGTIAEIYLKKKYNIEIVAFVSSIGIFKIDSNNYLDITREEVDKNDLRFPNQDVYKHLETYILDLKNKGNSIGGIVSCVIRNCPVGIGEPCFDKLEAQLAHAMMSIPASKGFEIGSGFSCSKMTGKEHNDIFIKKKFGKIGTLTNNSGGIQGGISNGEYITFNIAFKPPASISIPQQSTNLIGETKTLEVKGRHDPVIVNRAIPIVESMAALVILDNILLQEWRNKDLYIK